MHNECCFHLMVTRFAVVYICSTVDGHKDVIMIFLIDLHILLTFLDGNLGLTPMSMNVIDVLKGKMLKLIILFGIVFYSLQ